MNMHEYIRESMEQHLADKEEIRRRVLMQTQEDPIPARRPAKRRWVAAAAAFAVCLVGVGGFLSWKNLLHDPIYRGILYGALINKPFDPDRLPQYSAPQLYFTSSGLYVSSVGRDDYWTDPPETVLSFQRINPATGRSTTLLDAQPGAFAEDERYLYYSLAAGVYRRDKATGEEGLLFSSGTENDQKGPLCRNMALNRGDLYFTYLDDAIDDSVWTTLYRFNAASGQVDALLSVPTDDLKDGQMELQIAGSDLYYCTNAELHRIALNNGKDVLLYDAGSFFSEVLPEKDPARLSIVRFDVRDQEINLIGHHETAVYLLRLSLDGAVLRSETLEYRNTDLTNIAYDPVANVYYFTQSNDEYKPTLYRVSAADPSAVSSLSIPNPYGRTISNISIVSYGGGCYVSVACRSIPGITTIYQIADNGQVTVIRQKTLSKEKLIRQIDARVKLECRRSALEELLPFADLNAQFGDVVAVPKKPSDQTTAVSATAATTSGAVSN